MATIWRVLKARGLVTPQPHKRPKSSWIRFAAEFPNECWQGDVTHVSVAGGAAFEVLNIIDDHSRLCLASRAFATTRAGDVIRTLHKPLPPGATPDRSSATTGSSSVRTTSTTPPGTWNWNCWPWASAPSTPAPTTPRPAARSSASTRP